MYLEFVIRDNHLAGDEQIKTIANIMGAHNNLHKSISIHVQ